MELELFQLEALMLLPYIWFTKMSMAHTEFMQDLFGHYG
jgi:hypothetical protein